MCMILKFAVDLYCNKLLFSEEIIIFVGFAVSVCQSFAYYSFCFMCVRVSRIIPYLF